MILTLGTVIEPWGKLVAVGFVGERYYWFISKYGVITMLPASVVEPKK